MNADIYEWREYNQKTLYFKLYNAFNLNTENELNIKHQGVYAIFKDDICLYVGQSKNLASRIATHIRGKYKNATQVYCWDVKEIGFGDFDTRSKESQSLVLNNCEEWLMAKLKPIENINIDMDFSLNKDNAPDMCLESSSSFTLELKKYILKISDGRYDEIEDISIDVDFLRHIEEISTETRDIVVKALKKYELKAFCTKGFKNEY